MPDARIERFFSFRPHKLQEVYHTLLKKIESFILQWGIEFNKTAILLSIWATSERRKKKEEKRKR
jgi:hypothetical protein